jgi:N-acyl-L-homoserine lactone synthetase
MNGTPLRFVLDPVGEELAAALSCEAEVFLKTYGNTVEQLAREYDQYADSTGLMTLLDENGRALATCRFIAPGRAGLKTLNDIRRPPWNVDGLRSARAAGIDPTRTWDIATISVRSGSGRRSLAAAALYHGIIAAATANHIPWVVMIMDSRARRLLSASGLQTRILPGTTQGEYLGSPTSTPLWADVRETLDLQRQTDPEAYRLIYQGIGLDGITLPTDWTWHRSSLTSRNPAYA